MVIVRKLPGRAAVPVLFAGTFLLAQLGGAEIPPAAANALSATLVQCAENELTRVKTLVENGTLARSQLDEAKAKLDDARDEAVLLSTLYGQTGLQNMTDEQTHVMIAAAQRRVDRQQKLVADHRNLLEAGVLARSEVAACESELDGRKRVLALAQDQVRIRADLHAMADMEARFEREVRMRSSSKSTMLRYEGNGLFKLNDLSTISDGFEQHFHHSLPVSAVGETLLHRSMGLDHRNRVDVALNPDSVEGAWLRQFLEKLRIPYLAFRSAVAGAATAPHIHIGPESTRLVLARR
jgi:hypothetical protein